MKKCFSIFLVSIFLLSGCVRNTQYERQERPYLCRKDIDVVVESIDKHHWFASTHWYKVKVSVKSEEYQLTYTDEIISSGVFGCPSQWEYNRGDIVKAELYSWVMDSTGEIIMREIHKVY